MTKDEKEKSKGNEDINCKIVCTRGIPYHKCWKNGRLVENSKIEGKGCPKSGVVKEGELFNKN